jgi:molybdopterin synthase catalytic subunit
VSFAITREAIDTAALRASLENRGCGASVCFEGWVRNHSGGRAVLGLEYDVFEALARREGERIVAEARERFGIAEAACVHRVGALGLGDCAVWVGVASGHRAAAFEACRYIIDEVKARVPIWKKELFADGDAEWVECAACSHAAAEGNAAAERPAAAEGNAAAERHAASETDATAS